MTTTEITALTTTEQQELQRHEDTIARGVKTFFEVGAALTEIRDARLYRSGYETFDDYCRERWQFGRSQAYRLMDSAAVVANLSPTGDTLPANEAQARPLVGLPPEEQRAVWQQAVETMPGGKPTGAHVAAVVEARNPKPAPPVLTPRPAAPPPRPADDDEEIAAPGRPAAPPPPLVLTPLAPAAGLTQQAKIAMLIKRELLLAAVAQLEQELARMGGDLPEIVLGRERVDQAARMFLVNPALGGAASLLGMGVQVAV